MSQIEHLILSRDFPYLQPYFYNHPHALRCELGWGRTPEEYAETARARAEAIYRILFPTPADALIFSYWIYDRSFTGDPGTDRPAFSDEARRWYLEAQIKQEAEQLRFLDEMQSKYRHAVVRDLPTYDDGPDKDTLPKRVHFLGLRRPGLRYRLRRTGEAAGILSPAETVFSGLRRRGDGPPGRSSPVGTTLCRPVRPRRTQNLRKGERK